MKKIILKLVQLFGLTSLERTTKLEYSIDELTAKEAETSKMQWRAINDIKVKLLDIDEALKNMNQRIAKIENDTFASEHINDLWEGLNKVTELARKLEDPNWNKTTKERLKVMHDSEQTTAYQLIDSPYVIAREEKDYFVIIGKYRINQEPFETLEEAIKYADQNDWTRQMHVIQMFIENNNEMLSRPQRRKTRKITKK